MTNHQQPIEIDNKFKWLHKLTKKEIIHCIEANMLTFESLNRTFNFQNKADDILCLTCNGIQRKLKKE